jgi:hypothetical protein
MNLDEHKGRSEHLKLSIISNIKQGPLGTGTE